MLYFAKEINRSGLLDRTAGVKARDDAEEIFKRNGAIPIEIPSLIPDRNDMNSFNKLISHFRISRVWEKCLNKLQKGDTLYIQFPLVEHTIAFRQVINGLRKRGIITVILIHDVESLRNALRDDVPVSKRIRLGLEEVTVFKKCSYIIVHNENMKGLMINRFGLDKSKLKVLKIFDYLMDDALSEPSGKLNADGDLNDLKCPVVIAGAFFRHKAGYVYELPDRPDFALYGIGYEDDHKANISYKGSFDPNELPHVLNGSFGLVWDGPSADSCKGIYGKYLRINDPHKASLYLACGIPLIIWKHAALAEFAHQNGCAVLVESLDDIDKAICDMSQDEYLNLKKNAAVIGAKIRSGHYLTEMIKLTGHYGD